MAQDFEKEDTGGEYQFQEEQETPEYKYEEQAPTETKIKPKKRPLFIAIGAILVIFIIYEIVHLIFGGKPSAPTQPPVPAMKTENIQPVASPTGFTQPSQQQAPAFPQQAVTPPQPSEVDNNSLANQLTQLQTANQDLSSSLEKQQFQMQTNMMSMQENLTTVGNQLQQITESLQDLVNDAQAQKAAARRAAWEKQQQVIALRKKKSYFVDAVIPGRAWLKGADGSTITVTVGETIPGYGKVTMINAYSGVVRTTSGTIPYGTSSN